MKITKVFAALLVVALGMQSAYAAYPEVSCSSDASFSANACSQCFDGGTVSVGDNLGLLTDDLLNEKSNDIIVYKEEQEMPNMVNLSEDASWSQTPSGEWFWEYTDAFNALYSSDEDGYVIDGDSSVVWLQSKLGYAYTLDTNTAAEGTNVGMLVYKLISHDVSGDGDISIDSDEHNECVLFASGDGSTPPPELPPELPETGAEHWLLAALALILGFGVLKFARRA